MNKHINNQRESKNLEKIKWFSVCIFFILSSLINYYFYDIQLFIRVLIASCLIFCAICILLSTKIGKCIFSYLQLCQKEMKKIIWPEYKDTLYTTLVVISVTIVMSLILWSVDNIIFRFIAFIISLRF